MCLLCVSLQSTHGWLTEKLFLLHRVQLAHLVGLLQILPSTRGGPEYDPRCHYTGCGGSGLSSQHSGGESKRTGCSRKRKNTRRLLRCRQGMKSGAGHLPGSLQALIIPRRGRQLYPLTVCPPQSQSPHSEQLGIILKA